MNTEKKQYVLTVGDRIGNLSLRVSGNILEIVKWYPNHLYDKKQNFSQPDECGMCRSKDNTHYFVHKGCFDSPETCYTLASWNLREKEPDLVYCGKRPLELDPREHDIFEKFIREGYEYIESIEK